MFVLATDKLFAFLCMHFISELSCGPSSILIQLAKMTSWNTAPRAQEMFCVVLSFKSAIPIQNDKVYSQNNHL